MPSGQAVGRRLLIVTHRRLDAERSGSKTYLRRMIDLAEAEGLSVWILCLPRTTFSNRPWAEIDSPFRGGIEVHWPGTQQIGGRYWARSPLVWARFGWRLVQAVLRRLPFTPENWSRPWSNLSQVPSAGELDKAAEAIQRLDPDAVMVEYSSLGPLLGRIGQGPGKAILMHDAFSARAELFLARGEDMDFTELPDFEAETARMRGADVLFHASVNELERFAEVLPRVRHVWFRPSAPLRRDALKRRERPGLVYVGANQKGSRDAIAHFLSEIWPLVRASVPEARVNIVGPVGETLPGDLIGEGVDILGTVPDLAAFAGPDMIGLVPTRLASGISIKVGEYLGMGAPIVAYRTGIDGFGDRLEGAVMVAEDRPEAFAAATVRLLQDPALRRRASEAGLVRAEALFNNGEVRAALRRLAGLAPAAPQAAGLTGGSA